MVAPHEVGEHPVGRTSAAAQLAGVVGLHLSSCVEMIKLQSVTVYYRTRVRSLLTLVTNSLTHSLTNSCLVNLIDVTLAFEDVNSKLVEVATVADVELRNV